ncbi:uncharacterized mitochondrial protein AtMg00240-like [Nicotiana tomentosiformis]|uniref:uncharacterized mitochondrial protein AtMg00240-like n=1 Tax=Nicotiana tomentosiformis TaxID=4098 RepID=UPI00388CC47A
MKFGMSNTKAIGILMIPSTTLDEDKSVDAIMYQGMIGSLLYLIVSRPDIMFSVCKCAKYQLDPKESDLTAVKRIIKYLIGTVDYGLWYESLNSLISKVLQMQTLQEIKLTEKAQVINYLKNLLSLGTARSKDLLPYILLKRNTWL